MKLTEQQLFDYIHCPTKYHIKYIMKIDIQESISMTKLLNVMSRYFYLNLFNGKVPTYDELRKKWDSLCETHSHYMDHKKVLSGWGQIVKFVQWAEREKIIVGDIESKYMFPIDKVEFYGNIEAILIKPNKEIELLTTSFSERSLDRTDIDMKLKHTMDYVGFKALYGVPPTGIKIHSVKYDEDLFTNRTQPDIVRLTNTISNVAKSIEDKIFYPRESSFCSSCTAKQYCKYWHI